VRTRCPSCSRKPASESGFSLVISLFVFRVRHSLTGCLGGDSFLRQTNFAKVPPIEITLRFQPFGFDECFDPVCYKVHIHVHGHFESYRHVSDDARNLKKSRFAARQDGLIY
jgi:hypothetical protein